LTAEQDRKFFDTFMLVLGALVAVAVGIYILAQWISGRTQEQYVKEDPALQGQIQARIEPVGQVAVAGAENAGLRSPGGMAPKSSSGDAGATTAAPAALDSPEAVYNAACAACHAAGVAGAPALGDAGAWSARIAQGMDTLVKHAIEGFQGQAGYMPPKGGNPALSDEQVRSAVQHMVDASGS
jgi:cytochrome c5